MITFSLSAPPLAFASVTAMPAVLLLDAPEGLLEDTGDDVGWGPVYCRSSNNAQDW